MVLLSITESYGFSSIFTGLCIGPLFVLEDKWIRFKIEKSNWEKLENGIKDRTV